jgi:hypothetical protein
MIGDKPVRRSLACRLKKYFDTVETESAAGG